LEGTNRDARQGGDSVLAVIRSGVGVLRFRIVAALRSERV
jgi:hypothetical protein